jgi:hypothetical protein
LFAVLVIAACAGLGPFSLISASQQSEAIVFATVFSMVRMCIVV